MNEKDVTRLAGELLVAIYQHGGAVPYGPEKCAELAVSQARALRRELEKPTEQRPLSMPTGPNLMQA